MLICWMRSVGVFLEFMPNLLALFQYPYNLLLPCFRSLLCCILHFFFIVSLEYVCIFSALFLNPRLNKQDSDTMKYIQCHHQVDQTFQDFLPLQYSSNHPLLPCQRPSPNQQTHGTTASSHHSSKTAMLSIWTLLKLFSCSSTQIQSSVVMFFSLWNKQLF